MFAFLRFTLLGAIMSASLDKTCVICGQDCAGQPRIKNERGQYAHKACVAKKQASKPEPIEADPIELDDGLADGLAMDDLLGDIDQAPESPTMRSACPSCGNALDAGAVICMKCGHNTTSGKKLTSKVITPKDPGAATAVAAKAGGAAALPVLWAIGGCIGGAVGATIWAAIAYFINFEIGYVAVLVGFLTGVGVHVASMGRGAGAIAGAIAAVIALASIAAGKYAAVHFQAKTVAAITDAVALTAEDIDDAAVLASFASDLVEDQQAQGETIDWPNPGMIAQIAQWPDDYPEDVRIATIATLDELSDEQRSAYKRDIAAAYTREWGEHLDPDEIDEDWLTDEIAMDTVDRFVDEGKTLDWPSDLWADAASWPDDYPQDIRDAAQAEFDAMSPAELDLIREDIAYETSQMMEQFSSELTTYITEEGFKNSFDFFDILWAFLAIGAAFAIASGEGFSLMD